MCLKINWVCLISKSFYFVSKVSSTFNSPIHHFYSYTHTLLCVIWIMDKFQTPSSFLPRVIPPYFWHSYQLQQLELQYKNLFYLSCVSLLNHLYLHRQQSCCCCSLFRIWFIRFELFMHEKSIKCCGKF